MNSRDDAFLRRIEDAARSLRKPSPAGGLERARANACDLDAAIDVAARSLAGPAPPELPDLIVLLDLRIAAAARDLKRPAPDGAFDAILADTRAGNRRSRMVVLRNSLAIAASLVAAALLFWRLAPEARATPNPALLTSAALAQSLFTTAQLDREADKLARRVQGDAALAADDAAQARLEQVAFLDQALEECEQALEVSPAHAHLREQLVELSARRVELLRQIADGGPDHGNDGR